MNQQYQSEARAHMQVDVLPLVNGVRLPHPAPARTRSTVPAGYGVQEQCLPFVAATSLGWLVPSPFAFGLCPPGEVPDKARAFRSPLDIPSLTDGARDPREFYVVDDPECAFAGNAFTFDANGQSHGSAHRAQAGGGAWNQLFSTAPTRATCTNCTCPTSCARRPEIDALYTPPINRPAAGLHLVSGLVQTDWYANPVNLVLRKPPDGSSLHVQAGDPLAQVVFLPRGSQSPAPSVLPGHARLARDLRRALGEWYRRHDRDRSAYKRLARDHTASAEGSS